MNISKEDITKLAKEVGFDYTGILEASKLKFRTEVRDMCKAGRCRMYGKNWACPPACGSLEESEEKASHFEHGIILQSVGNMEDDFDVETMQETEEIQKERFNDIVNRLAEMKIDVLPMSSGTCTLCKKCAHPEPCRFPEKQMSSMEAYGLVVSDSCALAKVDYYHGPQTIAFTGCILFND